MLDLIKYTEARHIYQHLLFATLYCRPLSLAARAGVIFSNIT